MPFHLEGPRQRAHSAVIRHVLIGLLDGTLSAVIECVFAELSMKLPGRRFRVTAGLVLAMAFVAVQFIPYGRDHVNPPVAAEPAWDSPETRALAKQACFDCHSNETEWPVYSSVAPASWLIQRDIAEGRAALNFSEWHRPQKEAKDAAEEVLEGEMPLRIYQLMHAHARLGAADRERLARGLERTLGQARTEARVPMLLAVGVTTLAAAQPAVDRQKASPLPAIPSSLKVDHEKLHADLSAATALPGRTGEAAKQVATVLHEHFVKEEEFALPPLALLGPIAEGHATPDMRSAIGLTDRLQRDMPQMLREHEAIVQALNELGRAAEAERHPDVTRFVEELTAHAQTEEQVLYPAAILVGEYLKLKFPERRTP